MGDFRERRTVTENIVMESTGEGKANVKIKITGDVEKCLMDRIRMDIEDYNRDSGKKVGYRISHFHKKQ